MSVFRVYAEKKSPFAVEAKKVLSDLSLSLQVKGLRGVRVLNRYDVQGLSYEDFLRAVPVVFSEPPVDEVYEELPSLAEDMRMFAVEYLPGQFDQRADSCEQCIQLLTAKDKPIVKSARVFLLSGELSDEEFVRIKQYLINPVESREASLEKADDISEHFTVPSAVQTVAGFITLDRDGLQQLLSDFALAMDLDDLLFCQSYFRDTEKRDATVTEIRMIDTYWSDHCRHTTFSTLIESAELRSDVVKDAFAVYEGIKEELYPGKGRPTTLMDIATIGGKYLKKQGLLPDLDESEEINACSVKVKAKVSDGEEDWLLMFKNETHNHPTEIEPFGGAATCLGGAIRDPLSGRSYVYAAMRVTGAGNPLLPVAETRPGKLPQRKITTTAAAGYSSYGNQIGLATGLVDEIYHDGYVAKRMEIGAVLGAAPAENIRRERPAPSDVVILLGGKTGRDGCGGATGSSKSHTLESLESCGAEVQKGNPPEERKLQRLFRNKEVTALIKRCNDFGAGGVSVAIGELADGLTIDLDAVPKKYEGLDGTELAISESQERMAVVVSEKDAPYFIALAAEENLSAEIVAVVTEEPRLRMLWQGVEIASISREFLDSNGAPKTASVKVVQAVPVPGTVRGESLTEKMKNMVSDLNSCSKQGLSEMFDSTIGAGTVLMPFGGKYQQTPPTAMVHKLPVFGGDTSTCSVMSYGFDPFISEQSPFHGAVYAIVEAVAKVIAAGGSVDRCWLTLQEYFERTKGDPMRFGKPFAALLGALMAQMGLQIAAIGGKDSMSGSFEELDVPPTLTAFAVSVCDLSHVLSPELKKPGNRIYWLPLAYNEEGMPDFEVLRNHFRLVEKEIEKGTLVSAWATQKGGIAEGLFKMAIGNRLGFAALPSLSQESLFTPVYGSFLVESTCDLTEKGFILIGEVIEEPVLKIGGEEMALSELLKLYEAKLAPVFPKRIAEKEEKMPSISFAADKRMSSSVKIARPRVIIPVFPGTNCEYDTAAAFERAGAAAEIFVIRNRSVSDIETSIEALAQKIGQSQIVMLPGGFSGGDEPEGSGKFITAFFKNPLISDAVHTLLKNRDGLILGICNGFQALIKLGLVPYGEIADMNPDSPTLTFNNIGRHQSMLVTTRIASNKSPWLSKCTVSQLHTVPISHGEGRFVATQQELKTLIENGQIATQYVDLAGNPTMDIRFNPNGSMLAVEGITSPDGRVLGKMAHSERIGKGLYKNVPGNTDQMIFEAGVEYFR